MIDQALLQKLKMVAPGTRPRRAVDDMLMATPWTDAAALSDIVFPVHGLSIGH